MRNTIILTAIAGMMLIQPAYATKPVSALNVAMPGCKMQETVSIGISFNITAKTMMEAKAKFDEKMKQLTDFAAQQKVEKFEPQSMNYNIYTQNSGNADMEKTYQLNGSAQYQLQSTDVAFRLADFLEKQKFNVNINSNAYRTGNCQPTAIPD